MQGEDYPFEQVVSVNNHAVHIAWRAESRGHEGDVNLLPTM